MTRPLVMILLTALLAAGCATVRHEGPRALVADGRDTLFLHEGDLLAQVRSVEGLGLKALRWVTGSCVTASIGRPTDVAVDGEGRVLVCDGDLSRVVRLSPEGCSPRPFEVFSAPEFATPTGVEVFPAGIAVADAGRAKVFLLSSGTGRLAGELSTPEGWSRPGQMHWDGSRLRVVDGGRHVVESFDAQGHWLGTLGREGGGPGEFLHPVAVAVDPDGQVWVLDALNHRVQSFTPEGRHLLSFGVYDHAPGGFMFPKGLAFDEDGNLYVSDAGFSRIQVFSRTGALLYWFGGPGREGDRFLMPGALCARGNRIYIADQYNRRIQVYRYLPYLAGEGLDVGEARP
ncbi:MAG: hypothetical protein Q8O14_08620 [bacterium]|jgi:DNA-binding beta-propeller fold protein YncE|nr:hypothetical protein [bacterium]